MSTMPDGYWETRGRAAQRQRPHLVKQRFFDAASRARPPRRAGAPEHPEPSGTSGVAGGPGIPFPITPGTSRNLAPVVSDPGIVPRAGPPPHPRPAVAEAIPAPMTASFRAYVEDGHGGQVVTLEGELDLAGVEHLQSVLAGVDAPAIRLDLTRLQFIDAAGLNALLAAKRSVESRGGRVTIAGATGIVRRVFDLCGVGDVLDKGA